MQIVILGMHRSGTSAVSRLINMMGAYIGPERSMGAPAPDNEKGFWERTDVRDLNDLVLQRLGCAWDDPIGLDLSVLEEGDHYEFEAQARRILLDLDARRPWVMKDPRMCLLFPLWRPLLEVPVCVHVHRSPLEVAQSLRARNGFPLPFGLALWETYMQSGLRATTGLPRILVDYHAVMHDPVESVAALHRELSAAGIPGLRLPATAEIRAFLDERLFHQRAEREAEEAYLNLAQSRLAHAIEEGSILEWDEIPPVSAGAQATLEMEKQRRDAEEQTRVEAMAYGEERDALVRESAGLRASLEVVERARAEVLADCERLRLEADEQARAYGEERDALVRESAGLRASLEVVEQARTLLEGACRAMDGDMRLLIGWLHQIEGQHTATQYSWRWRLGHGSVSIVERLLRRSRGALAAEQMTELLHQFRSWYFDNGGTILGRLSGLAQRGLPDGSSGGGAESQSAVSGILNEVLAARTEKPDLFVFPIIDWHFRVQRPQHIARELAGLGHRVFYFTTRPISGKADPGFDILESPEPGVFICSLHHGGPALSIYDRPMSGEACVSLHASLLLLMEQCAVEGAAAIVDLPFWRPLAERIPGCALIYDCMDHHAGFSTHTSEMGREEDCLLRSADVVVTTSAWLSESVGRTVSNTIIRNGAEVEAFREAADRLSPGDGARPVVGYMGTIAEWFDLPLVVAAACAQPDWDFVLVGSTHGCDTCVADDVPNIRFLGERPYREVPGLVASFDVCIIPFRLTDLIVATNPVKVYEYLSAGKPVVTTDLPEVRPLEPLVHVATSEADFIDKLKIAMGERADGDLRSSRQAWALDQDWSARARMFDELIATRFPRVSVVVLTYNNLLFTQACLDSLERFTCYPDWELILVDNASSDGTPDWLSEYAARNPRVRLILNDSNLGFAAGNNAGIRAATGEYVVILNNDTYVTRGWLFGLIRHMLRDERLGLVGPVTNNIGNEAKIDIQYGNMRAMAEMAMRYTTGHPGKLMPTKVAAFFCVAISRRAIDAIGLLDEQFGIGFFEDDDYCRRARDNGYEVAIAEDVFVHHHLSASFNEMEIERRQALFEQNRRLYEQKWGAWEPHRYRQ